MAESMARPSDVPKRPMFPNGTGPAVGRAWPRRRQQVYERDGRICGHCGATDLLQIDHKVPRSLGGTADMDNLHVLCRRCNVAKGTLTWDEFIEAQR